MVGKRGCARLAPSLRAPDPVGIATNLVEVPLGLELLLERPYEEASLPGAS